MAFSQPPSENSVLATFFMSMKINASATANYMLLWVGTFIGVCLSYAIRTHTFTLADLTRTDADYLAPTARLLLTGSFVMLLTLAAVLNLVELSIGSVKLSDVATNPLLAFLIGSILGISEQKLTGTVEKRFGEMFSSPGK